MKKRISFVSNSSSCSFVIVGNRGIEIPDLKKFTLTVPYDLGGTYCFQRGSCVHYDVGSRINWAFLQAIMWPGASEIDPSYLVEDYWKKKNYKSYGDDLVGLVRKTIMNVIGFEDIYVLLDPFLEEPNESVPSWITTSTDENKKTWLASRRVHGYIDHGSAWSERPENLRIFDSEQRLTRFLFDRGSRIHETSD